MPTKLEKLEKAFIIADDAGNVEDAKAFAGEIRRLKSEQQTPPQPELTTGQKTIDFLRSIPKGVSTAAIGTAALPGMIQSGVEYAAGIPTPKAAEPALAKYFEALRKIPKPGSILPSSVQSLLGSKLWAITRSCRTITWRKSSYSV